MHLFSMAGVAEMMCKHGAGDKVLQLKQFDPFGFHEFYGVTELFDDVNKIVTRAMQLQEDYDKIVIHDFSEFREHFPKDKVIFIFHGTKLRQMDEVEKSAVSTYPCFVTTTDLIPLLPNAIHLPNMVDLEHFKNNDITPGSTESWVCINRSYQGDIIKKNIKEKYPETVYYERTNDNLINYADMPDWLEQFDNYVDMKYTYDKPEPKILPDLSCTGLQALAVGCKVWNANGKITDYKTLALHDARNVTLRFLKEIDSN